MVKTLTGVSRHVHLLSCLLELNFYSSVFRCFCTLQSLLWSAEVCNISFPNGFNNQFVYYPASSGRNELWKQTPSYMGMSAKPTLQQEWCMGHLLGPSHGTGGGFFLSFPCSAADDIFAFWAGFPTGVVPIIHPSLQMRSFECLFLPHNLRADSPFCALYFDQFLNICGQLFGKLCFWMLALLTTWCARPCVLDRLCWFFFIWSSTW